MWLHRWFSLTISPLPPIFGGNRPCQRGDIKFSICHVNSCNEKVIWHYEWVSLIISPYSTKFGDHQPWRRGDILFLTCHVTSYYTWSEDHLILRVSLHPANIGGHRCCAIEKKLFFVFHVTSRDFAVGESCDIVNEFSLLINIYHLVHFTWNFVIFLQEVLSPVVTQRVTY